MRSVSRLIDTSINTVSKLLEDAGRFCAGFHDAKVRGVKAKRVQVDELWSFTAAKQKNVAAMKNPVGGAGDTWTWTAIEADTKLLISHFVGGRDGECAKWFIDDMASRIVSRIQLTSDGDRAYLEAIEGAFGANISRTRHGPPSRSWPFPARRVGPRSVPGLPGRSWPPVL